MSRPRYATAFVGQVVLVAGCVLALAVVVCLAASGRRGPEKIDQPDPGIAIQTLTAAMSNEGRYRNPDEGERLQARDAVERLLAEPNNLAAQDEAFGALGFSAQHGTDPSTGRPFSLFVTLNADDRAWGALLVDRSAPLRVVIEVPHPRFDINTEMLGVALHRQVPGSALLVAGAHREAGDGDGDVAHNSKSLFHVMATEFARDGLPQIQLHGFADKNLPDAQAIVSTGAAPVRRLARDVADGLEDAGLVTCRAWSRKCGQLEGTRNEQGQAADELDSTFIHLELGYSVRRESAGRDLVVRAIAAQFELD
jgi:hypothetical protein